MTGNELGTSVHFFECVLEPMGDIVETPVPRVGFGDVQTRADHHRSSFPDAMCLTIHQDRDCCGRVLEFKMFWTVISM